MNNARQGPSMRMPDGTADSAQTMESSAGVRVIEEKGALYAHSGTGSSGFRWQTARGMGSGFNGYMLFSLGSVIP